VNSCEKKFRESAKTFIITILTRLLDKSPLQYSLVKNMICLDARRMASKQEDCKEKMKRILHTLVQAKRLPEDDCDAILQQYGIYLEEVAGGERSRFSDFKPTASRIDTLLYQTMACDANFTKLWKVVQQLLLLSHGQATVERGFSVNRQIEVENRKENSYIAHRIVCDHIEDIGGINEIFSIIFYLFFLMAMCNLNYIVNVFISIHRI